MKKVLSEMVLAVLVISMILSLTTIFSGCAKKDEKPKDSETDKNPDENPDENEENKDILSYLPDEKFNKDFIIICGQNSDEFLRETSEGDRLDYAIYMRNTQVEERYGVKLKAKDLPYNEVPDFVSDIIKSGDNNAMDIVGSCNIVYQGNNVIKGNATNLQEVPHIDLTKPWWAKSTIDDLTLNGKSFIAFGDMNTSAIGQTYCMFYNKELCKEYGIPDMYNLVVKDQNWTFDVMMGYLKNIRKDLDNDGRYTRKDLYGLATSSWSYATAYIWAWDNPIFRRDDQTGELKYCFYNKKLAKICDMLVNQLYYRVDGVYHETQQTVPYPMFTNDQAVFINGTFDGASSSLRNMPVEKWGICPYPKYNSKQKNYISSIDGAQSCIIVPKCNVPEKLEKIGVVTEALNALSHESVVVEYYDVGLKSKYIGDPKEAEVIDMIMANRVVDFGYIYAGFDTICGIIHWDIVGTKSTNVTSAIKKWQPRFVEAISKSYEAFGLTFEGLN